MSVRKLQKFPSSRSLLRSSSIEAAPDEPIKLKRPLHAGDFSIVELVFSHRINLHAVQHARRGVLVAPRCPLSPLPPKILGTSSTINPVGLCVSRRLEGIIILVAASRSLVLSTSKLILPSQRHEERDDTQLCAYDAHSYIHEESARYRRARD